MDESLSRHQDKFIEPVLEIGNGSVDRRGRFQHRLSQWYLVDLSRDKHPHMICNGEALPAKGDAFPSVVSLEVLEHVERVNEFVEEIYRVLKPGGRFFLSTPFLYRYHAAPNDYQRFTEIKIRNLLKETGFDIEVFEFHGYYFTVLADQLKSLLARAPNAFVRKLIAVFGLPLLWLIKAMDGLKATAHSEFLRSYTTGYFVIARKRDS